MNKLIEELKNTLKFTLYFPKQGVVNSYGYGQFGSPLLPMIPASAPDTVFLVSIDPTDAHTQIPMAFSNLAKMKKDLISFSVNGIFSTLEPAEWDAAKEQYYPADVELRTEHLTDVTLMTMRPLFTAGLEYPYAMHQLFNNPPITPDVKRKK